MNVTFGIMAPLEKRIRNKQQRCAAIAERALTILAEKREILSHPLV